MAKILHNTTNSSVPIADTGIQIPANGTYTIQPQDYWLWASSSDIITKIGNGTIVVNDGSVDLSINEAVSIIQHMFPSNITINNNNDEPIPVTGNLTVTLKQSDIQRNAEFNITSKVETDIAGVSYTVTSGKTFYLTQFAVASDSPSPVAMRLRVYNGATLVNTIKINISSNGAWGGHSWPNGVLYATEGMVVKATFDPQAAKGSGWAMFAGFEV